MKKSNWKTILLIGAALAAVPLPAHADEQEKQQQRPPRQEEGYGISDDGTEFVVDPKRAEAAKAFVNEAGVQIEGMLADLSRYSYVEARTGLNDGINRVVGDSKGEDDKTLMRMSLKRGQAVKNWFEEDTYPGAPGLIDSVVRVLWRSVKFSQHYAKADKKYLDAQVASKPDLDSALPTAEYGLIYNRFITELDDSIVNGKTQFRVLYKAIHWLSTDLQADPLYNYFGVTIAKLEESQKKVEPFYLRMEHEPWKISPREYIAKTKQLRWDLQEALKRIPPNYKQPWETQAANYLLYE